MATRKCTLSCFLFSSRWKIPDVYVNLTLYFSIAKYKLNITCSFFQDANACIYPYGDMANPQLERMHQQRIPEELTCDDGAEVMMNKDLSYGCSATCLFESETLSDTDQDKHMPFQIIESHKNSEVHLVSDVAILDTESSISASDKQLTSQKETTDKYRSEINFLGTTNSEESQSILKRKIEPVSEMCSSTGSLKFGCNQDHSSPIMCTSLPKLTTNKYLFSPGTSHDATPGDKRYENNGHLYKSSSVNQEQLTNAKEPMEKVDSHTQFLESGSDSEESQLILCKRPMYDRQKTPTGPQKSIHDQEYSVNIIPPSQTITNSRYQFPSAMSSLKEARNKNNRNNTRYAASKGEGSSLLSFNTHQKTTRSIPQFIVISDDSEDSNSDSIISERKVLTQERSKPPVQYESNHYDSDEIIPPSQCAVRKKRKSPVIMYPQSRMPFKRVNTSDADDKNGDMKRLPEATLPLQSEWENRISNTNNESNKESDFQGLELWAKLQVNDMMEIKDKDVREHLMKYIHKITQEAIQGYWS